MKKSRFSEEQIIAVLKESQAGIPTRPGETKGQEFVWQLSHETEIVNRS